jgi:hypothetical protein
VKWLILGALLGLLLVCPPLLAITVTTVTVVASKPLVVAFGLGLAARPHLPGRWAR